MECDYPRGWRERVTTNGNLGDVGGVKEGEEGGKMDKMTQEVMFSSKTVEWSTPEAFYEELNNRYGFTLDPCANAENSKCARYFSKADDGLSKSWGGETVFCNPPYGRQIKWWIKKAYEESLKPDTTVVMLIPSRTDTAYWHDYVMRAQEIAFVRGRLKFGGSTNPAPFPSAVVVFSSLHIPKLTSVGAV